MKKLLSLVCLFLYLHSFAQAPAGNSQKASGEKVLIKALSVIVNPAASKKTPEKKIHLTPPECPLEKMG
jgi:hypothetical protein